VDALIQEDIVALNRMLLQFVREIGRRDYGVAAQLFGLSTTAVHRLARMNLQQIDTLARCTEPMWKVSEPKVFAALVEQILRNDNDERIELTRLAFLLAGTPPAPRDADAEVEN